MNDIAKLNSAPTMTSLELVDFINEERKAAAHASGVPFPIKTNPELRHDHFMDKVPRVLGEDAAPKFLGTATYVNGTGGAVDRQIYIFPKREACLMAMSYSYELQARVFDRMTALEAAQAPTIQLPNFTDPAEAAIAWAAQFKAAQAAQIERDEAIRTKAQIGSRREASAMAAASAAKREASKLRDLLGANTRHATVTAVQNATGTKYAWLPLRKWCEAHDATPASVPDARYGDVKAWPAEAWGDVHAVSLQELFGKSA